MRVMKYLAVVIMLPLFLWVIGAVAQNDFDWDALFDFETEDAPVVPSQDNGQDDEVNGDDADAWGDLPDLDRDDAEDDDPWGGLDDWAEPAVEPDVEPAVDPVAEPAADDGWDDLFDFADEVDADEPAVTDEPAVAEEPAVADEPAGDLWDDLFDFADEDEADEPTVADDPADDPWGDLFDLVDEPTTPPAVEDPDEADDDLWDDLFDFADDEDDEEVPAVAVEPERDAPVAEDELDAQTIAARQEIRRQAAEVAGRRALEAGFKALETNQYAAARQEFETAMNTIPPRPATLDLIERARWGLAEANYLSAREIYQNDGELRMARQFLTRARELSPDHRGLSLLERRIDRASARRLAADRRIPPVAERPEVMERRESVEELMAEGIAYYKAGELNRAEAMFDTVLVRDEYHIDAMRYLRRISEDKMRASSQARATTTAQMMQDVRDAWTPPRRDEVRLPEDLRGDTPTPLDRPSRRLEEKMREIIIPRIEFRNANIQDVVSFLRDASEAADTEDGDGVNIILNLSVPGGRAAATTTRTTTTRAPRPTAFDADAWDDPWGSTPATPATGDAMDGSQDVPRITLNLRRISLMEAIRYITEVAGLRFRIEDNVVVITPEGVADVGRVVTRLYPVQPSFFDLVAEQVEERPTIGIGEFGARPRPDASGRAGDVKAFFEGTGVPFPAGTSITYNPTISQLIVANTPENLERFERILMQLNDVPAQVEIEARFVEVIETDMKELGLQWLFTDNYQFLQRQQDGPLGSSQRVQVDAGNVSQGQRFFAQTEAGVGFASLGAAGQMEPAFIGDILSISSILTNPEMRVVVHALSQKGNVDVLSAPRITTRSGINATIEVVQEIIYPTDFDQQVVTFDAPDEAGVRVQQRAVTVTPRDFQMRPTGVILNVTPTVGPDGYTIDLALSPEVSELVDWLNYGSQVAGMEINLPQPIFASRNVDTSIVIWDGQTVVMGGLMRERLVTVRDKIPFLGDLPLVGRLFRTEGTRSQKENLLIFVTARLVDPSGKPIQQMERVPGVPVAVE